MIRVDVHHHFHFESAQLDRIEVSLSNLASQVTKGNTMNQAIKDAIDALSTKVSSLETVEASAVTLL